MGQITRISAASGVANKQPLDALFMGAAQGRGLTAEETFEGGLGRGRLVEMEGKRSKAGMKERMGSALLPFSALQARQKLTLLNKRLTTELSL
ncbi:hypothetical protein SRHO_G00320540 [Serrasalmus rhombeus]